jgi:hypothetical protein
MNIQDKKDLEKAISKLQKLKDDGVIPLFADGMLKAYNDLLPLVKKLTTPVVVGKSEQLSLRLIGGVSKSF